MIAPGEAQPGVTVFNKFLSLQSWRRKDLQMSFTNLLYHIVYATKERTPFISDAFGPHLHRKLGGIVRGLKGIPIEINGVADHVHLLVRIQPTISVSDFLCKLKAQSSGWAKRQLQGGFAWQTRYAAFTVSESQVTRVRKYIQNQKEHHRTKSFEEELKALLVAHHVDFDERYFLG